MNQPSSQVSHGSGQKHKDSPEKSQRNQINNDENGEIKMIDGIMTEKNQAFVFENTLFSVTSEQIIVKIVDIQRETPI